MAQWLVGCICERNVRELWARMGVIRDERLELSRSFPLPGWAHRAAMLCLQHAAVVEMHEKKMQV